MLFINYPKCGTCKKAKKYLIDNNIKFIDRDIKLNNPTFNELELWINKYNIDIKKLFNTSGIIYREMNLKDKLPNMNIEEKIKLLSSDGMLVKRPLLISDKFILIGFKEVEYQKYLNK